MGIGWSQKLEPGDLIEIPRGVYQHWAVYVGDGYVVHLVPPSEVAGAGASSVMSVTAQRAVVKMEKLSDVVGTGKWNINKDLEKKYKPRPTDIIVKDAHELVGKTLQYDIRTQNCEHFATMLRYGKAESMQVRVIEDAGFLAGVLAAFLATFATLAGLVRN